MSSSPSSWRGRALLVLLVTLSLLTATRGASALTAFERLVISELNATKVGGIDLLYGIRNYTVPTAMNAWDAGIVASVVMISADPYVLTQAQAEFLYAQTTVRYQDVAMPVRASVVRGCTAVHAMCCTYYWVTEEYPPGLDLADLDTSLVFWNGTHSTGSIDVNFTGTFPDVDCSATDASLIPVAQQRSVDTHSIVALAFTKNAAIKSPLVWDIFSGDGVTGKRRYVEFSTVHNTAPEQKAFIERMLANTFSAFGDPWQTLGEDAMNFQIPTDKLVKTTRSKSLGAIPVVVPIVVSAVLLVTMVVCLLVAVCICERKWQRQLQRVSGTCESSEESLGSPESRSMVMPVVVDVEEPTPYRESSPSQDHYDSARKTSLASRRASATSREMRPTADTSSVQPSSSRRSMPQQGSVGNMAAANMSQSRRQSAPSVPNPLAAPPSMYSNSANYAPSTASSLPLAAAPNPTPMPQPFLPRAGSMRPAPSMRGPPMPTGYAPSSTPFVLPSVPFVASPPVTTPPVPPPSAQYHTEEPSPDSGESPADEEGTMSRRGSGMRRKNSMVSWKLKDIEL